MHNPIVCLSEQLRQYLEAFRPCFSQRQRKNLRKVNIRATVQLGLIECEERKTLSGSREPSLVGLDKIAE